MEDNKVEVLFLNSCYSENLGRAFFESGVANHVITVNSTNTIGDNAAIHFSSEYVKQLLNGATRCDAFFLAKEQTKLVFPREADSFRLMKHNHERIHCPIHRLPPGSIIDTSISDQPLFPFILKKEGFVDLEL